MNDECLQEQDEILTFLNLRKTKGGLQSYKSIATNKSNYISEIIDKKREWALSEDKIKAITDEVSDLELHSRTAIEEFDGIRTSTLIYTQKMLALLIEQCKYNQKRNNLLRRFGGVLPLIITCKIIDCLPRPKEKVDVNFYNEILDSLKDYIDLYNKRSHYILSFAIEEEAIFIANEQPSLIGDIYLSQTNLKLLCKSFSTSLVYLDTNETHKVYRAQVLAAKTKIESLMDKMSKNSVGSEIGIKNEEGRHLVGEILEYQETIKTKITKPFFN